MLVKDISDNMLVSGKYMIMENRLATAKTGSKFLAIKLADRSGEIGAKVWNANEDIYNLLAVGEIIELTNVPAKSFNGVLQLDWESNHKVFRILSKSEADYSAFLPQSPGNVSEYWHTLQETMESIQEPMLQAVLKSFFDQPEFVTEFLRMPAALKRHHAYIGGLAEHTAGVVAICNAAAAYYPLVNRDLLLTGAILHDIGKIKNYQIERGFEGTDEGKLIGHLVLGVCMVQQAIKDLGYGDFASGDLGNQLLHLLVSHHGIMEWGSPIEPLTVEGCILHHADNLDAQTVKFLTIIREQQGNKSAWAPYDTGLQRSLYLGRTVAVSQEAES